MVDGVLALGNILEANAWAEAASRDGAELILGVGLGPPSAAGGRRAVVYTVGRGLSPAAAQDIILGMAEEIRRREVTPTPLSESPPSWWTRGEPAPGQKGGGAK